MTIKIKGFKKANIKPKCLCKSNRKTINTETAQYPLEDKYLRVLQMEASIIFDRVMKQATKEIHEVLIGD